MHTRLAIFASGGGSNAENIIQHFSQNEEVEIALIVSNKPQAFVLQRAQNHNIDSWIIDKSIVKEESLFINKLRNYKIDYIILAGYLWKIPKYLIKSFPNKIINIHPALLPKYGGKGMYGHHVHQAVFDNFEKESGITIHYVNASYDEGHIIFQKSVGLGVTDTPDIIAKKVLELEHKHYGPTIAKVIN